MSNPNLNLNKQAELQVSIVRGQKIRSKLYWKKGSEEKRFPDHTVVHK